MKDTIPIFIVGSGRSGTRLIYKLFKGEENIEIYHEYCCELVQKIACLYSMNKITKEDAKKQLLDIYNSAIYYSNSKLWIDCSNKASWIIDILIEIFPTAKFLCLTRDGRKVTSSFLHKLGSEIYDNTSVSYLWSWINDKYSLVPMPPVEKKYWWNLNDSLINCSQFEKICHHWVLSNQVILDSFKNLSQSQCLSIKLENLVDNIDIFKSTLEFLGIEYNKEFLSILNTPQNAIIPANFKLTKEQEEQFSNICTNMMQKLNYDINEPTYEVEYVL